MPRDSNWPGVGSKEAELPARGSPAGIWQFDDQEGRGSSQGSSPAGMCHRLRRWVGVCGCSSPTLPFPTRGAVSTSPTHLSAAIPARTCCTSQGLKLHSLRAGCDGMTPASLVITVLDPQGLAVQTLPEWPDPWHSHLRARVYHPQSQNSSLELLLRMYVIMTPCPPQFW